MSVLLGLLLVLGTTTARAATGASDRWEATLDRVTRAVVSIRMDRPRAFEGRRPSNSIATGFVVDADEGLILTNRHVVTAGPTIAKAVLLNHEEIDLVPVYRDPVHDFGVFRYDPADVRFMDLPELELRPDRVRVGVPIRVVGNDSGEQISILDSTLARLDRPAPTYGGDYNDFNTFYIQAASSTSGGSSGSPVVDVRGHVLALNAGGKTRAASSFYLPLDRVVRALDLIRAGEPVPRGTLQTRFEITPFDELGRLGLSEATEAAARLRDPDGTGLLVVRDVLPDGPAHGRLRVGDVLLEVAAVPIHDFVTLEALLDDRVGDPVAVVVERAGERVDVETTVGDLHAIVPSRYLTFGEAVLHDLSYHQARVMQRPVRGVYVASPGYVLEREGIPRKAVIVEIDGRPTDRLDDLVAPVAALPHGGVATLRWYRQGQPEQIEQTAIRMDRRWFPAQVCTRDDARGVWPCTPLGEPSAAPPEPTVPQVRLPRVDDRRGARLAPSLVRVENRIPYQVAGVPGNTYAGGGLIVDAERGWVLVDRDTVPIAVGEIEVVVAGTVRVPGRLVALHPVHDLAIVAYDPQDLEGAGLTAVELAPDGPEPGDKVWSVTLMGDASLRVEQTTVKPSEPLHISPSGAPRFRETNLEVVQLDADPDRNGALVDRRGRVLGFHASFSYTQQRNVRATMRTIGVDHVRDAIDFARGIPLRWVGWELRTVDVPTALELGLSAARADTLTAHDPERRQVLVVERVAAGSGADGVLRTGDLVLAVGGVPVTRYREAEEAARVGPIAAVTVLRQGREVTLSVPTDVHGPVDVDRVVLWAGLRLHAPHRAARLVGMLPEHPYVAWRESGSPAGRARLFAQRSIVEIDGRPTPSLEVLIEVLRGLPEDRPVRVLTQDRSGEQQVFTLEPAPRFWPTEELVWSVGAGWQRRAL